MIRQEGLVGALQVVAQAAEKTGKPLIDLIGRKEAWILASALAGEQADDFSEKLKSMSNVAGVTDKAFEEQTQGLNKLGFAWQQAKVKMEVMLQRLGDALAPIIMKAASAFEPLVHWIEKAVDWFTKLPQSTQTTIVAIAGVAAAVGPLLVIAGKLAGAISSIAGLFSLFSGGATAAGAAAGGAAASTGGLAAAVSALTGPVGIAIAAIVALVAAYATNFQGIRDAINGVVSEIIGIVKDFIAVISDNTTALGQIFAGVKTIVVEAVKAIGSILAGLFNIIQGILKVLRGDWEAGWNLIKQGGEKIWNAIVDGIKGILSGFVTYLKGVIQLHVDIVVGIWNGLVSLAGKIWGALVDFLAGIWEKIKNGAVQGWNAIISFFTQTVPNKLGELLSWFASLPGKILEFLLQIPAHVAYAFGVMIGLGLGLIKEFVTGVVSFFVNLPGMIADAAVGLWNFVKGAFQTGIGVVLGLAQGFINGVVNFFKGLPDAILGILSSMWEFVKNSFLQGVEAAKQFAVDLFNGIKEGIAAIPDLITGLAEKIWEILKGLPGKVWELAKGIGKAIWDGIKSGLDIFSPSGPERDVTQMSEQIQKKLDELGPSAGAKAKKAGKAIYQGFDEGTQGIDKAFDYIAGKISSSGDKLFADLVPKVKKGSELTKQAFSVVMDTINEYVKAQGSSVKVTERDLQLMEGVTRKSLMAAAQEWKNFQDAVERANFAAVTQLRGAMKSTVEQVNEYLSSIGVSKKASAEGILKWSAEVQKAVDAETQKFIKLRDASLDQDTVTRKMAEAYSRLHPPMVQVITGLDQMTVKVPAFIAEGAKLPDMLAAFDAALALSADGSIIQTTKIEEAFSKVRESIAGQNTADIISAMDSLHQVFIEVGTANGLTLEQIEAQWKVFSERLAADAVPKVKGTVQQIGKELSTLNVTVKSELDRLTSIAGEGFAKMVEAILKVTGKLKPEILKQFNDTFEGIVQIAGALPGKLGERLRGGINAVTDFVNRTDQILKGLHKIFKDVPDGIGPLIEKLKDIFTGNTNKMATQVQTVGTATQSAAGQVQAGARQMGTATSTAATQVEANSQRMVNAINAIGAAAAMIGGMIGGRVGGAISGAGAGMMMGAQIGALFGPAGIGIGALIGGIGGGIAGLFGGGKSRHQKEMERMQEEQARLQIEQMKQSLQKGAQEVIQTAIKTFEDALKFFEQIEDFDKIPRRIIKQFFANLKTVLDYFMDLVKDYTGEWIEKAKAFAEALGPAIELVGNALEVFIRMPDYVELPKEKLEAFGRNLDQLTQILGDIAERTPGRIEKQIRKFSERMLPAADLVNQLSEGLQKIVNIPELQPAALDRFGNSLERIIDKVGSIEDKFDSGFMRAVQRFSERAGAGVQLFGDTADSFNKVTEARVPTEVQIDQLADRLIYAIKKIAEVLQTIDTLLLRETGTKAEAAASIVGLINAVIEPFLKADQVANTPVEKLQMLADAMRQAIRLFIAALADISQEMLAAASSKAGPVKDIMDAIGGIASAVGSVANFPAFDYNNLNAAVAAARQGVEAFMKEMNGLDAAAVGAASATAKSMKEIFDLLVSVQNILINMAKEKSATIQQLIDLVAAFKLIVDKIVQISNAIGSDVLNQVVSFSLQMKTIVEILTATLQFFTRLAEFTGVPTDAIERMDAAFDMVLELLRSMLDKAVDIEKLTKDIADIMQRAASNLAVAAAAFGDGEQQSAASTTTLPTPAAAATQAMQAGAQGLTGQAVAAAIGGGRSGLQATGSRTVQQTIIATVHVSSEDLRDAADVVDLFAELGMKETMLKG